MPQTKEQYKAYYKRNRDRILARNKAWREANKEQVTESKKRYSDNNKEANAARGRAWRAANPERKRANARRLRAQNKEKALAYERAWKAKNRAKLTEQNWVRQLKRWYNLTPEEYWWMAEEQGNVCCLCRGLDNPPKKLAVDHCHTTNKVRGLLCMMCNSLLGLSREREDVLQAAIEYLRRFKTTP